ncbi:phage portal protein [Terricaulis silvestris]|uniref:Phage portal protein, HK97 family n=1 Tax=Terricaulis silvestris TaxID=2686094 RepID=A0A6I6MQA9_9CAUL|nr:phage portal protein [Terricaulis silvestris]QGZ95588.1 phage portal protein, HK97 family [Terricaulis silvestris]
MLDWWRRLRAPRVERKLLAWHALGRPAWSARDPSVFAREGYARNAIAYRCVRMIAEAAASAPLKVGPADHPLARLLARPNPEQTGIELLEAFYGHLQVSGNAYLEAASIESDAPSELYVLRPDRMSVVPGADGWPVGWEHRVGSSVRKFERDPVTSDAPILHLKLFHPADDWYGLSPMEAAAFSIDIHNAGGAWNKALIDNAARPSGALVFTGAGGADRLSEEQFRRLKQELEDMHVGAANAGRPMLLEGGLEWRPMSLSPSEMDFSEARHSAARDIALAFGVPPMLLGIPGDNTYSNYREANLAFWRQTALPLAMKGARGIEAWIGDRWPETGPAAVNVDVENVPALTIEREALWSRIGSANFLSEDEKRRMAGVETPERAQ